MKIFGKEISQIKLLLLLLILSLHLFLRLYNAPQNFGFGHDEDLSGWIAKDIIIEHNLRLIGQETSVGSVFIGPIFYYLESIFYFIVGMDPIGGLMFTLTISVITLLSIYYVFKKFFGETVGIFGSIIYAASQALAGHDSWIVPTQPTILWTTWFLFALFWIVDGGSKRIFILLGILIGLIWHVHIAFIPLLLLIPLAFLISKKSWNFKELIFNRQTLIGLICFLILMLPFFAFEIRHNFLQTQGLINSLSENRHQSEGRLFKIYDGASWSFMNILYEVRTTVSVNIRILQAVLAFFFIVMLIFNSKHLGKKSLIIFTWLGLMIISQIISKRAISEYYFTNLTILEILTIAFFLNQLLKIKTLRPVVFVSLGIFVLINLYGIIKRNPDNEGYLVRKKIVAYIKSDASAHNYQCIAINYMTSPGKNAGFRYFFWLNDLKLISPANDVPVYSILNPAAMSEGEITYRQGSIGVIPPNNPNPDPSACNNPTRELLPLWGFNN